MLLFHNFEIIMTRNKLQGENRYMARTQQSTVKKMKIWALFACQNTSKSQQCHYNPLVTKYHITTT